MRPAIGKRQDVVDERRLDIAPARRATFAERMRMKIPRTHLRPAAAVPRSMVVATSEAFVMLLHLLLMRVAPTALVVREIRAARVAARALRLPRHPLSPLHTKSPDHLPRLFPSLSCYQYSTFRRMNRPNIIPQMSHENPTVTAVRRAASRGGRGRGLSCDTPSSARHSSAARRFLPHRHHSGCRRTP